MFDPRKFRIPDGHDLSAREFKTITYELVRPNDNGRFEIVRKTES